MRKILFLLTIIGLFSCANNHRGWKTIEIGTYLIDVPDSITLKYEHGIDSEPGTIHCKGFDINFDYGMYTDTLTPTVQEYLKLGRWRDESAMRFIPKSIPYDYDYTRIKVQSIRPSVKNDSTICKGCDYVAICLFKSYRIMLPIILPPEIRNYMVKIDTIDRQTRRLVVSKNIFPVTAGIYMGDIRRKMTSDTMYNTIAFLANKLDINQRKLVLKIFATLRPKK